MNKPIQTNPVANVPTNWASGDIITHTSYNSQAAKINEALTDIGAINDAFTGINNVKVYSGTSTPSSSVGVVGDLYIQTE